MKTIGWATIATAIMVTVAACSTAPNRSKSPAPAFPHALCSSVGDADSAPRLRGLVVGESWAGYGYMFPNLPATLSARSQRPVTVCSLSMDGATSQVIADVLRVHRKELSTLFGGQAPDFVIVLNGVNDQVQHVGAAQHARETAEIVDQFRDSPVYVVSAPYIHVKRGLLPWRSRLRYLLNDYLHDGGRSDVAVSYRAAMRKSAAWHVIDYDAFMPGFTPAAYKADGAHLTPQNFARYGTFLGTQIPLP